MSLLLIFKNLTPKNTFQKNQENRQIPSEAFFENFAQSAKLVYVIYAFLNGKNQCNNT